MMESLTANINQEWGYLMSLANQDNKALSESNTIRNLDYLLKVN
jgi:hypothetical protein